MWERALPAIIAGATDRHRGRGSLPQGYRGRGPLPQSLTGII